MQFASIYKRFRAPILAAAAAVAGVGSLDAQITIQGGQVNISGATLFADFFLAPASTHDWIDANNNSVWGYTPPFTIDQLATSYVPGSPMTSWWGVNYRGVGSGNGLRELVHFHTDGLLPTTPPSDLGLFNRYKYIDKGVGVPNSPMPETSIDIGGMDVPTTWFVTSGSQANATWSSTPTANGYGLNPIGSWDTGQSNRLRSLAGPSGTTLNTNTATPDNKTVYDTELAWVPVAFIANRRSGVENITQTELQHLYTTGRMPNGENLVAATRDAGSGTRNAAMNPLGIDPSWGRGDNLGSQLRAQGVDPFNSSYSAIGPNHQATNMGGSGHIEVAVQNNGLAVGYTGLMGGSRAAADASAGLYEIANVMFDAVGGVHYVRPSLEGTVKTNMDTHPEIAWIVGGAWTAATVGNPLQTDPSAPDYMANQHAAAYMRNIVESINAFNPPLPPEQFFMPGDFLAGNYVLTAGTDAMPNPLNPSQFVVNAGKNQAIQDYILDNNVLVVPDYGTVNPAGLIPNRISLAGTGQSYNDGSVNGNYTDAGGNTLVGGQVLSKRNKLMGDFNYDGVRNANDIPALMQAVANPATFQAGYNHGGDGFVAVHIIGDFNADGNFDADDIRYFADGLAIDPSTGNLNRALGFTLVDQHGGGNFFGTTIATGNAYSAGDSRADIAGNATAPGADPRGADGVIDGRDLYYVYAQFAQFDDHVADWSDLSKAPFFDLSADMTGNLKVTWDDFNVVAGILGTTLADFNYDGKVDNNDALVLSLNYGKTVSAYQDGDINGDGIVDHLDVQFYNMFGLLGDFNSDGVLSGLDIPGFKQALADPDAWQTANGGLMPGIIGDFNGDGAFSGLDIPGFKQALAGASVAAVPEPATMLLLLGGLGAIIRRRR